ncbi:MAG: sulfite exporter TauE/SafE family protein [Bacteroidetes bacterium]|nr:sulfite exporter TauE/SafE family protein [Bacteroidota bacterium]MBU1678704.1 sulfite exporter TauE/SafE family protein [Bacteroidota bacterium]
MISIPLLSFLMDVKSAIALGALCGLLINIYLLIKLKSHVNFPSIKELVFASVLGIPIGVVILRDSSPGIIKIILAIVIILFSLVNLTWKTEQRDISKNWGYLFGFLSGLLGGAFNTNGPPILIYLYLQKLDKNKLKASITGFFFVSSIFIVGSHYASGVSSEEIFLKFIAFIPFVAAGQILGAKLFGKISIQLYNRIILISLIVTAILMNIG